MQSINVLEKKKILTAKYRVIYDIHTHCIYKKGILLQPIISYIYQLLSYLSKNCICFSLLSLQEDRELNDPNRSSPLIRWLTFGKSQNWIFNIMRQKQKFSNQFFYGWKLVMFSERLQLLTKCIYLVLIAYGYSCTLQNSVKRNRRIVVEMSY